MPLHIKTKNVIPTGEEVSRRLPREAASELHAIRRLRERYEHIGVTYENAPDTMIEHLAMLLAGQTEHRMTSNHPIHGHNQVHRLRWNGHWVYLSYNPDICRIVTYLTPQKGIEKLARPKILRQERKNKRR
jgi:hypothetical protein